MRNIGLILILVLMLGMQACVVSCNGLDTATISIDGYELKYENELTIQEDYSYDRMEIQGGTTEIDLKGENGSRVNLRIQYKEYAPGDAIITLAEGRIKTDSKSGKPVMLTNISGTIPEKLSMNIENGTGAVKLHNLQGSSKIEIDTGTGAVELSAIRMAKLSVDTGTGAVNLHKCIAANAEINTGTGSVYLTESYIEAAEVSSGTGSLNLKDSTIEKREFDSGTGKLHEDGKYRVAN